jgi:hypothetical protein
VQRVATVPVIVVLALFAVWIGYGATRVAIIAESRGAGFWTSIAVLYAFAAAAAWFAFRLYRIRQLKR